MKDDIQGVHIIVFASWGSQRLDFTSDVGTPNNIQPHERMGILPTRNGLNPLDPLIPGLYFERVEFDEYLGRICEVNDLPTLSEGLCDWIFHTSRGHIGAIDSVLECVKSRTVCASSIVKLCIAKSSLRKHRSDYVT